MVPLHKVPHLLTTRFLLKGEYAAGYRSFYSVLSYVLPASFNIQALLSFQRGNISWSYYPV